MQEHRVDRLANHVHAAEAEREVRDTAADLAPRTQLLDLLHRLNEVDAVVVVLLHPGPDRQDVRVEHDVLGREADRFAHEQVVAAFANADLVFFRRGLALLVERHHDRGGAVLAQADRVLRELLLADLQRNAIHDRLALAPLDARFHDLELGRIDHERHLGHVGLGHGQLHELLHRRQAVQHAVVHVDVDHVRAGLDLVLGDVHGLGVLALDDQPLELARAGDVAALADVDERQTAGVVRALDDEILETGEPHAR
mmetsp:Transcript_11486/g.34355  ORF Transcript_11486/g.34355 Transcript_11486/m.34355 type:complete len:255 (-) Transcript_11486:1031-1795(-)